MWTLIYLCSREWLNHPGFTTSEEVRVALEHVVRVVTADDTALFGFADGNNVVALSLDANRAIVRDGSARVEINVQTAEVLDPTRYVAEPFCPPSICVTRPSRIRAPCRSILNAL